MARAARSFFHKLSTCHASLLFITGQKQNHRTLRSAIERRRARSTSKSSAQEAFSRHRRQGHRRFPSDPLGSRYQRGPERYSLSVGLSRVSERLGSICAQATCIAL